MTLTKKFLVALTLGIILAIVACDGGYDIATVEQTPAPADVVETQPSQILTAAQASRDHVLGGMARGYVTQAETATSIRLLKKFQEEDPSQSIPPPPGMKSVCGADGQQCSSYSDCAELDPDDVCWSVGCDFDGCCAALPSSWNCCHESLECSWGDACVGNECTPVTCPPMIIPIGVNADQPPAPPPPECMAPAFLYRNDCVVQYIPSQECEALRPKVCHYDQNCWSDSHCVSGVCKKLLCFGQVDEGCYDPDVSQSAADWHCMTKVLDNGTQCDDGDPATTSDTCHAGKCLGIGLASQSSPH